MDDFIQFFIHNLGLFALMMTWIFMACGLVAGLEQVIAFLRTRQI
jgi:type IV secretory pathway TrbL component